MLSLIHIYTQEVAIQEMKTLKKISYFEEKKLFDGRFRRKSAMDTLLILLHELSLIHILNFYEFRKIPRNAGSVSGSEKYLQSSSFLHKVLTNKVSSQSSAHKNLSSSNSRFENFKNYLITYLNFSVVICLIIPKANWYCRDRL